MFRSLRTGWVSLGCRKRRYDAGEFRWAAENADMMLGFRWAAANADITLGQVSGHVKYRITYSEILL